MNWVDVIQALDPETVHKLMAPVDRFLDDVGRIATSLEAIQADTELKKKISNFSDHVKPGAGRKLEPGETIPVFPDREEALKTLHEIVGAYCTPTSSAHQDALAALDVLK